MDTTGVISLERVEERVVARTGRRVRNLCVEVTGSSITLRGLTDSYHVKQLAQHGVWDLLPSVRLNNAIVVA